MFNWRRRHDIYPRFRTLKPQFDRNYNLFVEFARAALHSDDPTIDLCELTYINVIHPCEFWKAPSDTNNIIPSFSLIDAGLAEHVAAGFNCSFSFDTANDVQLNVGVRSGMTAEEPIVPVLLFEIKATANLITATKPDADAWFARAHAAILDCFVSITDRTIQDTHWQRVEV